MKTMHRPGYTAALVALMLPLWIAPAAAQSTLTPEQMSLRVERLTESNKRIEEVLVGMRDQMTKLSEDVARQERLIDNRAVLDMIQQVDQLSEELSLMNGMIEEQVYEIDQIKKRQRELYLDIDRRLRDMESRAVTQAPAQSIDIPQSGTSSSAAAAASGSAAAQASAGSEQAATGSSSGSQSTTASLSASTQPPTSEEKEAYQAAFDTLKEGRYKKAKSELSAFLEKYPNSSFAGNAQYWLGEAHYVTRSFDQGIVEFEKVIKQYPGSNKVPDAMLKLGYTYYELKQYEQAKATLNLLREKFDKSTAARLASKRLDRIRKEGH
jgi:tol-pal system protein YbgF